MTGIDQNFMTSFKIYSAKILVFGTLPFPTFWDSNLCLGTVTFPSYLSQPFLTFIDPELIPEEDDVVFDRRERMDVKKPGPFFEASPNNFYLDKLTYR